MRVLLFGLLFGVALFASSSSAGPYPPSAKSVLSTVTVKVVWLPNEKLVDTVCSTLARRKPNNTIVGCFYSPSSTIYAVEPKSFNDIPALIILGHEFWHALGAEHPDLP